MYLDTGATHIAALLLVLVAGHILHPTPYYQVHAEDAAAAVPDSGDGSQSTYKDMHDDDHDVHEFKWAYAKPNTKRADPAVQELWKQEFPYCRGLEQSPIDVDTSLVQTDTLLPYLDVRQWVQDLPLVLVNNGHVWQIHETSRTTSCPECDGGSDEVCACEGEHKGWMAAGGTLYDFYQVHWHTPSENTIDGRQFPLEAHFVHQKQNSSGSYNLLVLALMYEYGDANEFLDYFWDQMPCDVGTVYTGVVKNPMIALPLNTREYYHWMGSLTTPPCTEGVSWNLLRSVHTVSQDQVRRYAECLNNVTGDPFNNRVIQPANHRVVTMTTHLVDEGVKLSVGSISSAGLSNNVIYWVVAAVVLAVFTIFLNAIALWVLVSRVIVSRGHNGESTTTPTPTRNARQSIELLLRPGSDNANFENK